MLRILTHRNESWKQCYKFPSLLWGCPLKTTQAAIHSALYNAALERRLPSALGVPNAIVSNKRKRGPLVPFLRRPQRRRESTWHAHVSK